MATPVRLGRRFIAGAIALAAFTMVGCSDQSMTQPDQQPEGATAAVPGGGAPMSVTAYASCGDAATLNTRITSILNTLYGSPQPSKVRDAQFKKYNSFKAALQPNPVKAADALKKLSDLAGSTLDDLAQGKVNGIPSPAEQNVATLISLLYCYYNAFNGGASDILPVPDFSDEIVGGGSLRVFDPARGTTQTFRSDDQQGGVQLPTNAYPKPLFITVDPIIGDPSPLNTDLDQYGLFYDFDAVPVDGSLAVGDDPADGLTFVNPVTVSICTEGVSNGAIYARLKLAHDIRPYNVPGNIEILDYTGAASNPVGLTCADASPFAFSGQAEPVQSLLGRSLFAKLPTNVVRALAPVVRFVMPEGLNASAVGFCCKSGTTSSFSPFGAVDPVVTITRDPTGGTYGDQAPSAVLAPKVTVTTAHGGTERVVRWLDVTWTENDASSVTPARDTTDDNGESTASWTLGPASETPYSLTATVLPARKLPSGFTTQSVSFTATAVVPVDFFFGYASEWNYGIFSSLTAAEAALQSGTGLTASQAPFGSTNANCALNSAGFNTLWSPSSLNFLAATRSFFVPAGTATVIITLSVDNDIRVYLDEVDVTQFAQRSSTNLTNDEYFGNPGASVDGGATTTYFTDAFLIHDNCPVAGDYTFTINGLEGTQHTISVIGIDRGTSTYFDAKVEALPQIN